MKLVLRARARQDIGAILDYSHAEHGESAAEAYYALIDAALDRLTDYPQLGTSRTDLRTGVRSYPVGEHRIYYRLTADRVSVIRLLHKSMDETRHV